MTPLASLRMAAARLAARPLLAPLMAALARPEEAQRAALGRILQRQTSTAFGAAHGFARIDGLAAFREAVPPQDHASLAPWIERQARDGSPQLTVEPPVAYARTSGTTAAAKLVPVTARGLGVMCRQQRLSALILGGRVDIFGGTVGAIAGVVEEDRAPGGQPCGATTGLICAAQPWFLRRRMALPPEAFAIADSDARYGACALLLLARGDLSTLATANPSTLLRLLDVIAAGFETFVDAVGGGDLSVLPGLSEREATMVARALRPDRGRARALRRAGPASPCRWWPRLRAAVTWSGGSCGFAAQELAARLGEGVMLCDPGYLASEIVGTVNLDPAANRQAPMLLDHVFEFTPAGPSGTEPSHHLGLGELEAGRDYAIRVTTPNGLYRYAMNDIVRVTGFVGRTPTLAFVQKSEGFTSITGEKLHESQVREAVAEASARFGRRPAFFMALADERQGLYRIYIELGGGPLPHGLAQALDDALARRNIEYAGKRASGRLARPLTVALAAGTGHSFRLHCVARGQRDAQFKALPLARLAACSFDFEACAVDAVS